MADEPDVVRRRPRRRRAPKQHFCLFCEVNECTHNILKYIIFAFNVFFWLLGLVVVGLGIWAQILKSQIDVASSLITSPSILLIVVGTLVFLLALLGCLGSLRENIIFLKIYAISLAVLLILQIIIGILAVAFQNQARGVLGTSVEISIENYYDDIDFQNAIDAIQSRLKCCGGNSPDDWENNIYFSAGQSGKASTAMASSDGVPWSCCRQDITDDFVVNSQCGFGVRKGVKSPLEIIDKIYINGCIDVVVQWMTDNMVVIIVFVFICLIPQFIAVFLAFLFARQVEDEIEEADLLSREAERRKNRESLRRTDTF